MGVAAHPIRAEFHAAGAPGANGVRSGAGRDGILEDRAVVAVGGCLGLAGFRRGHRLDAQGSRVHIEAGTRQFPVAPRLCSLSTSQ